MGQMLPTGLKQVQDYGVFFRTHYNSFLNPTFNTSRVYAKSTDFDRTLQSSAAFLSGVYQPNKDQEWTDIPGQKSWIPIPIHTNNLATDQVGYDI